MFSASERALAVSLYAAAPFAGPVLGPIVGGFEVMNVKLEWLFWTLVIFSFVMLVSGSFNPETYSPVLLRRRAAKLEKETGKTYRSMYDLHPMFAAPFAVKMKAALIRPFLLLIKEPICLFFALYMSVVYGLLYCFFGAFPLVYEYARGWSPGVSGLAFIPVGLGMAGVRLLPSLAARNPSLTSSFTGHRRERIRQQALRPQAHRGWRRPSRARGASPALLRRWRCPAARPLCVRLDDPAARSLDRIHGLFGLLRIQHGCDLPVDARTSRFRPPPSTPLTPLVTDLPRRRLLAHGCVCPCRQRCSAFACRIRLPGAFSNRSFDETSC